MKAILLAAGKGSRIAKMIEPIPKSTLLVNGKPLIRNTVEMFNEFGISCTVCVGYKKEKVFEALKGLDVTYYNNPMYDITNSIISLWMAKDALDDDVIIMNADVFLSRDILQLVLNDKRLNVLAFDTTRTLVGDYFFKVIDGDCLQAYGKELPLSQRSGEYVGIAKIRKEFLSIFSKRLDDMVNQQYHQQWWENVLYSFVENKGQLIYTLDINGHFWGEIDSIEDYNRILDYCKQQELMEEVICTM